ncbi:MAG: DUF4065 domain-containing protein [Salinivirgaceae bacterium]|nr:DUF4065 domain-containing protein [Salinivirgaceae bacterium]
MKSPITGKEMKIKFESDILTFRKERFEIKYHFYLCEDSKEQFTDDKLDKLNMIQVYNQYREKHGIPFPEQITEIREKYEVSASKMSEILGLGANSYRLYESGEMPSVAIGRLILGLEQPEEFIRQINASANTLKEKEVIRYIKKAEHIEEANRINIKDSIYKQRVFLKNKPEASTGFKNPDYKKTKEVIAFLSTKMELPKTKLNKLLFYSDFMMYANYGKSITGNAYRAVDYGPVPSNYGMLYEELISDGCLERSFEFYDNGGHCEKFYSIGQNTENTLTIEEKEILEFIANKFKDYSPSDIVKLSHEEPAWKNNIESKGIVSYQEYAFQLKAI